MNYYSIINVPRDATDVQIKRAFRKLALKWHPDKNEGSEESLGMFDQICEAYDVLIHKKRRAVFDRFGEEGLKNPDSEHLGGNYSFKGNSREIFEAFFGTQNPFSCVDEIVKTGHFGLGGLRAPLKPIDPTIVDVPCELEDFALGCKKQIAVVRKIQKEESGEILEEEKEFAFTVEPGLESSMCVRFKGEGDQLVGHEKGDVVLVAKVAPHSIFVREKDNLIHTAEISLLQALTECVVRVPTLDGRVLSIGCNEVIAPGYEKIIGGEGMPKKESPTESGDLILRFKIIFPEFISADKKSVLKTVL